MPTQNSKKKSTRLPSPLPQEHGATIIEYVLIVTLIALVLIAAESMLGQKLFNSLKQSSSDLDNASAPLGQQ